MADLVDVPGDHYSSEPSKSETHQAANTRAATRHQNNLASDLLLQPGGGQAEPHQLGQQVVDGHQEAQGHLQRYSQARLSLVQLLHYCALIGREFHSDEIFSE